MRASKNDQFAIGDSVTWISQWAKRDAHGKMIRYHGTLLEKAVDIPGWLVRRADGKKIKVRTAIMRLATDGPAVVHQRPAERSKKAKKPRAVLHRDCSGDIRSPLAKARDAWFESPAGKICADASTLVNKFRTNGSDQATARK